jgi:asparagine synthase (glutamine-hydrolysing)
MCGIAGILCLDGRATVSPSLLASMRDTMEHRGPDGHGAWISPDGRIGLAHRRLAIIDLSPSAAQPMSNAEGTVWLTFNGEIYNHAEIRAELARTGKYRWKTDHSDTEVILHAFEEWGIDCIHRFRGMFAFAIWDARSRELWLVRDRIGIKPLYYSLHGGKLAFASEIKAILADPERSRRVDEEAFFHYLSFLTSPAPRTLFEGIHKLPNGCWLRVAADGTTTERRYWDVWDHASPLAETNEDAVAARLLSELRTAVTLRKVSDVPVGVFLSGGVDSSTNAALFSEGDGERVRTFSIGYDGKYGSYENELHHARAVAQRVGAEHHEKLLTIDDLLDFLPRMVWLQDEPIADPVCVPVYYVSKLARDHGVVVCQLGEGADELFCGYPRWKRMLMLQRLSDSVPRLARSAGLAAMGLAGKQHSPYHEMLRRSSAGQPIFWGGAEAFTHAEKMRLLSPRLRRKFAGLTSWDVIRPIRERFEQKAWDRSDLNWMTYLDLNMRLPELLLMRVDKMSMGVSLEGRVPFLDHEFVQFAMSIPTEMKLRNGTLKHLLKKAVRGVIPDEVIDRPKQGFGVPVHEWTFDRLGATARDTLVGFCRETDFLDEREVVKLLDGERRQLTWYLLNFAMWWNEFVS